MYWQRLGLMLKRATGSIVLAFSAAVLAWTLAAFGNRRDALA